MGVRIIEGFKDGTRHDTCAVIYCSTTNWAFGPVFEDSDEAQAFLDSLEQDARKYSDSELEKLYGDFRRRGRDSDNPPESLEGMISNILGVENGDS